MWFSSVVSYTGAALPHLISCSLLENTGCFAEDCRKLNEIAKYIFKIVGLQKWERYLWTLWDVYIPEKNGSSSAPLSSPAFLLLHCHVVSCWVFLSSCTSCNTCCFSQNLTYLDLGELKSTSLFKYIFSSHVLGPSEQNKTPKPPHPRKTWKKMAVRAQKLTGKLKSKYLVSSFWLLIQDLWTVGDGNAAFINIHLLKYSRNSLLKAAAS